MSEVKPERKDFQSETLYEDALKDYEKFKKKEKEKASSSSDGEPQYEDFKTAKEFVAAHSAWTKRQETQEKMKSTAGKSADLVGLDLDDEIVKNRLDKLRVYYLEKQRPSQYTNVGLEVGRPKLEPMPHLAADPSNIFTRPSIDDLIARPFRSESNSVATAQELVAISAKLEGLGVDSEAIAKVMWDISMYCANASSSGVMDPKGVIEFGSGSITRDSVVAVIKDYSTLRRVCRMYAPVVWNYMIATNNPPSDWQKKGFTEQTKFAAFDFFDCVMNKACLQPLEGILRKPTPEENIANETHKRIALDRNSSNSRFANMSSEITGGKFGCEKNRKWRGSICNE